MQTYEESFHGHDRRVTGRSTCLFISLQYGIKWNVDDVNCDEMSDSAV